MSENLKVTLDELDYYWLPNGAPCFLANRINICDDIEALGFQIYYLIAHKETITTTTTTYKPGSPSTTTPTATYESKIFKVVNNFVGRAVSIVEEDFGDEMFSIKDEASYSMPAIPNILIDKLDEFFRLVYAQHGTESIVLLTYDTTKEGSEGWGILVPEQVNTAAHCKYDPDSIVDLKEDHIMIVGSVHSHPEMSAYASGTDHSDQADFDGLHITYGWQKSVSNGATQYHLELQMAGTAYKLTVDDVFEDRILIKDPDPDVVEWSTKVKKVLPPQHLLAGVKHQSGIIPLNQSITQMDMDLEPTSYKTGGHNNLNKRTKNVPFDSADYNGVVTAEIDISSNATLICPSCYMSLKITDFYEGSACGSCEISIIPMNYSINEIISSIDKYQTNRNLSTFVPYYIWAVDETNEDFLMMIKAYDRNSELKESYTESLTTPGFSLSEWDDDKFDPKEWEDDKSEIYTKEWLDMTICCGTSLTSISDDISMACNCEFPIGINDLHNFDQSMCVNNKNLYLTNSICESCEFYYTPFCSSYKKLITDFAIEGTLPAEELSGCKEWQEYSKTNSYSGKGVINNEL